MIEKLLPKKVCDKYRELTRNDGFRRLFTGGAITTICRFSTIGVLLGTYALNMRLMSTKEVGMYFSMWSSATFLAVIGSLGLRTSIVSWIADAERRQDWSLAHSAICAMLRIIHVTLLGMGAILCTGFVGASLFDPAEPVFSLMGGTLFAAWVFSIGASYALPEIFRGFHRHLPASIYSGLVIAILNGLVLGWLWMFRGNASLLTVMLVNAVSGGVNYLIVMSLIAKLLRKLPRGERLSSRGVLRHSVPIMIANASKSALEVLDTVVVGFCAGQQQAALYGIAGRLAALMNIPVQIVISTFSPSIAQALAHEQTSKLEKILRGATTVTVLPGLIGLALFVFAGRQILTVGCGPQYVDAAPALMGLALGNLFQLGAASATLALMLGNGQRVVMRLNTFAAVLTISLVGLASWALGATGAAVIRGVMLLLLAVLQKSACHKLLGVSNAPYLSFPASEESTDEEDNSKPG